MRSETFTPVDVLLTVRCEETPKGDITVTPLSAASFRIAFGAQAAVGNERRCARGRTPGQFRLAASRRHAAPKTQPTITSQIQRSDRNVKPDGMMAAINLAMDRRKRFWSLDEATSMEPSHWGF